MMKMKNNKILTAVKATLIGASLALTPAAFAADKDLLDALLTNGSITKSQYDTLMKKSADDITVSTKDGQLKFKSGDAEFQIGGRIQADAAWFEQDVAQLGDAAELRRARLFMSGKVYNDWNFKIEYDFAGSGSLKDTYIEYTGLPVAIKVGNFKEPFSLEEQTSSKYYTFMERALPNVFSPGRNQGLMGSMYGANWTAAAGLFADGVTDGESNGQDESYGYGARVTFAPLAEKNQAIHLGLAANKRMYKDGDVRFRARPEAHLSDARLVDTNDMTNVDSIELLGAEAAAVFGPLSIQGEYMTADVSRNGVANADYDFDGGYVYASYFLTGESRNYKASKGSFGRVKPNSIVGKGGVGAWELALRYSTLDLTDGAFDGGDESNTTLGLNWYATPTIRFMANYVWVESEKSNIDDDPNLLQLRAQIDF
tara:strand:- start:2530 stop:3810 length:1281 start_codon:yes stop_codon:yes gene_type:complete